MMRASDISLWICKNVVAAQRMRLAYESGGQRFESFGRAREVSEIIEQLATNLIAPLLRLLLGSTGEARRVVSVSAGGVSGVANPVA
jgi:hypothetical protein